VGNFVIFPRNYEWGCPDILKSCFIQLLFEPGFNGPKPLVIDAPNLRLDQATLQPQALIYKYFAENELFLKGLWLEKLERKIIGLF